jgi:hypothetical protein
MPGTQLFFSLAGVAQFNWVACPAFGPSYTGTPESIVSGIADPGFYVSLTDFKSLEQVIGLITAMLCP